MQKTGYIIVNVNDLSVPEFSLEDEAPFSDKDKFNIYNGPVSYIEKQDGKLIDVLTGDVFEKTEVSLKYKQEKKDKQKIYENLKQKISDSLKSVQPMSFIEQGSLTGTLRTWGTSYYCGVDGTAIILMYIDDYYDENVVSTNIESASGLTNYLVNSNYIYNSPASGDDILYGEQGSTGLNDYLVDRGYLYSGYTGFKSSYSWWLLKNKIDSNKPLMIGTSTTHPTYPSHWIIAHGYCRGYDGVPYVIVNNGFGSNNIYVSAADQYYPWGFVYISEF